MSQKQTCIIKDAQGNEKERLQLPYTGQASPSLQTAEILRERFYWVPNDQNFPDSELDASATMLDPKGNTLITVKARIRR